MVRVLKLRRLEDLQQANEPSECGLREWVQQRPFLKIGGTSNQLHYSICRLRHREMPERYGRGKCYDVRNLDEAQREEMLHHLRRHPLVCERMARLRQFPFNQAVFFEGDDFFWVIDTWEPGQTLDQRLEAGGLPVAVLKRVMYELAIGLQALHGHQIVRRELKPEFILLREADDSVLMTELELSKFQDGPPTVSRDFEPCPFLAPEVHNKQASSAVDAYSWGQILYYAASGRLPLRNQPVQAFAELRVLPKAVQQLGQACGSWSYKNRPGFEEIVQVMEAWQVE